MTDPEIMGWVTPPRRGLLPVFDPEEFAASCDTLYLLSKSRSAAAPLIALMGVRATLYEGAAVCAICAGAALLGLRGLRIAAADARVDPEGTDIGASHDAAGHLHADAAAITPAAPPQALR